MQFEGVISLEGEGCLVLHSDFLKDLNFPVDVANIDNLVLESGGLSPNDSNCLCQLFYRQYGVTDVN